MIGRQRIRVGLVLLGGFALAAMGAAQGATKSDYCYTPPSIASSLPPNVMIVIDNSGSMLDFAYDFADSDNDGFTSSGEVSTGYDPSKDYYGYFKSDYFYTYSSSKFHESRSKSGNTIASDEWDGNFLNWLTMRRVDIVRKVLTGGDYSSSTLVGEAPDGDYRGKLKSYGSPGDVTPCSTGNFAVTTQGGTAVFENTTSSDCPSNSYKIQLTTTSPISGLLDDIWNDVRFGLGFFNVVNNSGSGDTEFQGGIVSRHVDATTLSDFRSGVNEKEPTTATPLAETLYTMIGYFAQADTASDLGISGSPDPDWGENRYSLGVNGKDPYYFTDKGAKASCAQSFILFLTDGDPTQDGEIPSGIGDYDNDGSDPGSYNHNGSDYFDDVALFGRTHDLRSDLKGSQNVILYPVFAFGKGSDLIKQAAMNGGFDDLDGDGKPYTSSDCQLNQDNSSASKNCNEWDKDRDGIPDTYFEASDPGNLKNVLRQAFTSILERASSGSTVATISTQTRSGGELLQAYYRPKITESGDAGTTQVAWKGYMRALWTDPAGSIREDNSQDDKLKLADDRILQFYFDVGAQQVKAHLFPDADGNNIPDTCDASSGSVASQSNTAISPL
ncbi:MAG TPA: hypothetical protein VKA48_07330, partial [Gammaproteobacteria bacterium]|nr:hypothetical protein [Gammaproteobacteria bacterium]